MTGTGTVIEILKMAGALQEQDGKLIAAQESDAPTTTAHSDLRQENIFTVHKTESHQAPSANATTVATASVAPRTTIHINIACAPNELDDLGDKLRKLLRDINSGEVPID
jgi:hypothetical protein